jgi:hypothetical protein
MLWVGIREGGVDGATVRVCWLAKTALFSLSAGAMYLAIGVEKTTS